MPILLQDIKTANLVQCEPSRKRSRSCLSIAEDTLAALWDSFNLLCIKLLSECTRSSKKSVAVFLDNSFFSQKKNFSLSDLFSILFHGNKEHDCVSWLLVLVLAERLLEKLKGADLELCSFIALAFTPEHFIHTFFTLYCICFKLHIDFQISLQYLADFLPLHHEEAKTLVLQTSALERHFLSALDYHCIVSENDLAELLQNCFLRTIDPRFSDQ